ncbi:hypothetical protein TNCV_3395771 [Trichonephila clavipes]|nr:hypothetical protein TNCV_3395771 [Trichonephila clavipes]
MLAKNFKKYFLDEDSLVASYERIRDLFQDTPEWLSTSEEEIFIDFTSNEKLKGNFLDGHGFELVSSVRALVPQKFSVEEELMHVKHVEVKSPHVGVMWKFRRGVICSGIVLVSLPGSKLRSRSSVAAVLT